MQGNSTVLIWDSPESAPDNYENKVLWQSYTVTDPEKEISIPQLIEDNADELRSKYLAFIYDLGEAKIEEKKIVDYLEIRSGFSYWWMTLLVEKCNYSKSPHIDNIIKLMGFESWLDEKNFTTIRVVTANQKLARAVQILTACLGLLFELEKLPSEKTSGSFIRNVYKNLPNVLKAIISTSHYLFSRWKLRGVGIDGWKKSSATTLFVSYFFNLKLDESNKGKYKSRYWSKLPDILGEGNIGSNWLHLYVKNEIVTSALSAKKMVDNFNKSSKGKQHHVFLDSFLSVSVVIQTIISWFNVVSKYRQINRVVKKESVHYWPLLEEDVKVSILGVTAMHNLLFYYMFRRAMNMLPIQNKGMYLQENQGWEFGFIGAWRLFRHKQLIGVPHSTVRYWDLRYFFDSRTYKKNDCFDFPLPDKVAVNGEVAKNQYIGGKYEVDDLVEVEALRYLQLEQKAEYSGNNDEAKPINNLLVLGDYLPENTKKQMLLLQKAYQLISINEKLTLIVKPHPMYQIDIKDYPELDIIITDKPIDKLVDNCVIAYTSSVTSAAVDAYCAGIRVVSMLDPKGLNLSPLRNSRNVQFVSTELELSKVLNDINKINANNPQVGGYFYLDKNLPRWKALLQMEVER